MDSFDKEPNVQPFFYLDTIKNELKSAEAGRPIFDEVEMVEVRIAGDRNFVPRFPAHSMYVRQGDEIVTYAMRWPDQYAAFKSDEVQTASGTPLEELTFLTAARRSELKALKIYTAESLAALEGPNLKVLAGEGYKLKEQAQAYLNKANSFSSVSKLATENAELRDRLAALETQLGHGTPVVGQVVVYEAVDPYKGLPDADPYEGLSDDDLKEKIANLTGTRPRGNPSRATLTRMLDDIQQTNIAA